MWIEFTLVLLGLLTYSNIFIKTLEILYLPPILIGLYGLNIIFNTISRRYKIDQIIKEK